MTHVRPGYQMRIRNQDGDYIDFMVTAHVSGDWWAVKPTKVLWDDGPRYARELAGGVIEWSQTNPGEVK